MKKNLFILTMLLCIAVIPEAFAYNFQSGGIYYDITGSSPNTVAVTYATGSYNSYSGTVDIPGTVTYNGTTYTVTAIGNNAFRNCSGLTGVSIPGTVTSIGEYAFYQCGNLHTVDFPNALTTIGTHAFDRSGLYSVTIPASVTSIGANAFERCNSMTSAVFNAINCATAPTAFYYCSYLTSLTIGNNVHTIPSSAFAYCNALKSIYIPHDVSTIGVNPFHHCTGLDTIIVAAGNSVFSSGLNYNAIINTNTHTLVTGCKSTIIPNSVTQIGSGAFAGCTGLVGSYTIPSQITVIGVSAYSNCTGLTSLTIGHNVDSIGNSAFSGCSAISSVSFNADSCRYMGTGTSSSYVFSSCNSFSTLLIGNNVKAIPAYAFRGCSQLTGMLIVPNSVKTIGGEAFYGCNGLTSLSIGNSVTSIGNFAFCNCSVMGGTLTIPQSVKSIGSSAFSNCIGFTSLIFNAERCTTGSFSGCSNVSSLTIGNNVTYIPNNAFSGLNHITGTFNIPITVQTIGSSAFKNCSGLTGAVIISDSAMTVGANAFSGCSGITSLTIGKNVQSIGTNAFSNCTGLSSVSFNADSCAMSSNVFAGCSHSATLTIGYNVKHILNNAFKGLNIEGTLMIPDSVRTVGQSAFESCSSVNSLIIGRNVKTIGNNAFSNCNGLSSIIFNAVECTYMGNSSYRVFTGCTSPAMLTIGEDVKTIPDYAFRDYTSLTGYLTIPNSVKSIGQLAFQGCSGLTQLTIGDSVLSFGRSAFSGCSGLTGIVSIPNATTTIANTVFENCSGLDSLIIGKSMITIGRYAFQNCTGLSYIAFNADSCISMGVEDYNQYPIFSNCSDSMTITIGNNVKYIPNYAFYGLTGLTGTLSIPDSVLYIGVAAFKNCVSLDTLIIGKDVTTIGSAAFQNCSGLSSIIFNAVNCTSTGSGYYATTNAVFGGCTGPCSLIIADSVQQIPAYAFYGFNGLNGTVRVPDMVFSIGENAFANCNALDTLVLGRGITQIGGSAFNNCSELSKVEFFADSCVSMGGEYQPVFDGCTSSASLIVGNNVKSIPTYACKNFSGLDTLVIGNSVSYIGSAFNNCNGLSYVEYNADSCVSSSSPFSGCNNIFHLTIGNNVKCIPSNLFYECGGLSGSLVIPDSVVLIGERAFRGCVELDSVIIGRSVSAIYGQSFYGCTNLTTIYFNADSCTTMYSGSYYTNYDVFSGCDSLTSLIIGSNVKAIPEYAFRGASFNGKLIIPDAVTFIGQYAFNGCTGLDSLVIGNAVTYIGQYAFYDCTELSGTLNISHVDTIGYRAFYGCSGINSLVLGDGAGEGFIGGESFYNCSGLTGLINIPNNVTTVGSKAFYGCNSLDTLVIGKAVSYLGNNAFQNCTSLSHVVFNADSCTYSGRFQSDAVLSGDTNIASISLGNHVKNIPDFAFYRGSNVQTPKFSGKLEIPDSVIRIGGRAFYGCDGFDTLIIGKSVQSISANAFDGWSSVSTLIFNADSCGHMTSDWNNEISVFTNCSNLTSLTIGEHVKYLPYLAFSKCNHLTGTINIPDSLKTISSNAFSGCTNIDTLIIGKGVQMMDNYVFKNCTGLNHIIFNADSCTKMGSSWSSSVYNVFNGCSNVSSLSIGDNVKTIPPYAFYGLNHITGTLTIPDSVVFIGGYAFNGCSGYSSLILGRSVDTIGQRAFPGNIASIYSYLETPPAVDKTSSYQTFYSVNRNTPVYVPCGSAQAYRSAWTYSSTNANSYFYNIYETLQPYLLTTIPADTLRGTVHVTMQPTCTEPAVIEATPNFFYVFDHWSDGNTDNPRTIELTQDTTLVAHFREYALNIIQPSDSTYGQVIVLQQPTADNPQAVVEMIADTSCYNFYSWITPANDWESIGNENPITITLTQDTTIRATVISSLHMEVTQQPQWYDHVCEGDTMTLTASGANAYLWTTYHWDGSEGRYVDDDTLGFNADLYLTEVGSYRLRVTGTDSSGCKGWYNVQQVHVFPNPDFTISGSTEFCAGDSTSLSIEFAPPATITLLSEDFSNGLSEDWTIANHYLEISTIESSTHGNAVLFPCYNLSSNETDELLLPEMDLSGRPTAILKFDVAYRQYNYENDQLKLLYSTDNGATWYTLYSKSGSNLATLGYSSNYFTPNDLQWRTDSIILTETWNYTNVFIKFVFTSRYGNNLWIDNIRILSSDAPINSDYMQYTWNNGATSQQQTIESTGVYRVTVSDYACSTTDSVTVTVWQPSDTTELTVSAEHSTYTLNGETFCTSGDYTQILQNIHGCDSVVTIHLTVPTDTTFVYDTVCAGTKTIQQMHVSPEEYQQYLMYWEHQFGDTLPFEQSYDTLSNTLTEKYVQISFHEQWETGYNEYGNPTYNHFDTTLFLNYDTWKDSSYYDNFSYTITYPSSAGCDSTVTWHRKIIFSDYDSYIVNACGYYIWQGNSLSGNHQIYQAGDTLTQSGNYVQYFMKDNGCDSAIYYQFNILPASYENEYATACDSYTWNDVTYTESGDYTFNSDTIVVTQRDAELCDSWDYGDGTHRGECWCISQNSDWNAWECFYINNVTGDTLVYDDNTDSYVPGTPVFPVVYDTVPACKTTTLHLIVNESKNTETTAGSCDSYTWNDSTYTTSGDYTQTFTASNGCDSVVTLHLIVNNPVHTETTAGSCDSYTWNGQTYTASGDYTQTFTADNGCDSTVTLHLTILPLPTPNITGVTTVCEGQTATLTATGGVSYLWEDGTTTNTYPATVSGLYTVTVTNAEGCSATASTTVTVNPLPEVVITGNTAICPGGSTVLTATGADSYQWSNGSTNPSIPVNAFGQYSVIGTSAEGCFSTASVTVLVSQPPVITISGNTNLCTGESTTLTATGGVSYMWSNGSADSAITVNTAGNWQVIGYNENNCSNMASVTVNVWQPAATDLYITSFDSCYMWFGTPRCESGDYTHTLQTIHGCDSVITLHLTLEDAIVTEFSATACDSYTWNGATYSQSGNYTQSFTAVNGNDSIVTLHLTVNPSVQVAFADSTCTAYVWNGQTYTATGDYTQTFTAANGCDSVVTLHLTIVPAITPVISVTSNLAACGDGFATLTVPGNYSSFAWSTGSTDPAVTVSEAGFYWVTATDAYGCEGVSEMVQVGGSAQISETPALCMVGVEDQHNLVVWEPLADTDVAEYRLYRENGQANIFEPLAVIPAGSGNAYADTTADPSVRAWRYKITAADTCGGETPMSGYHKTVHLTINQGLGNSWNLIWTPYEGLEFASYKLYRGTANNNLQLIQTMPSTLTSFTDNNPSGDALFYQIEVVMTEGCVQHTRDITHTGARSNIVYNQVPVMAEETVSACDSYDWNGQTLTASGNYTQTFSSTLGYDSVVTLHLTVNPSVSSEFSITTEEPCYTWNSESYCASGDYTQTLQTIHGCDSVVTLHLTITVGIDDHNLGASMTVYPNPTTGVVNVQCTMNNVQKGAVEFQLFDAFGRLLLSTDGVEGVSKVQKSAFFDL